jgi:hypothetical protein
MKYSIDEISFILFNNRSLNGVVSNFLSQDINGYSVYRIETLLSKYQDIFDSDREIKVDIKKLDLTSDDIYVYPNDIKSVTQEVIDSNTNIQNPELDYLINVRKFSMNMVNEWRLGSLSTITNHRTLEIINATSHPILRSILSDGIEEGGIIIPLFKDDVLINCAIRKISSSGKLKYGLACTDIHIWGSDDITNEDIWIVEGLFDMMALRNIGLKAVSVSSAIWSGIQLYKLINLTPKSITIFCDNDRVGLKIGYILCKIFTYFDLPCRTVVSSKCKDADEHFTLKGLGMDSITDLEITIDMVNKLEDSFDILDYLKNRNF